MAQAHRKTLVSEANRIQSPGSKIPICWGTSSTRKLQAVLLFDNSHYERADPLLHDLDSKCPLPRSCQPLK
jgi:hypothetical protein